MMSDKHQTDSPWGLFDIMKNWQYGYVVNGKKVVSFDNFDNYKIMSYNDIEKYKIGTCWDLSLYEAEYFSRHFRGDNISWRVYYLQADSGNCHTWLSFKREDDGVSTYAGEGVVYAFEVAYQSHKGIHEFSTVKAMLKQYSKWCLEDYKKEEGNNVKSFFITSLKSDIDIDKCAGMKPEEFMNAIMYKKHMTFYYGDRNLMEKCSTIDWTKETYQTRYDSEKRKFAMMRVIYNSLSQKEKDWLGGRFIDSPAVVYRKVAMSGKDPVGFCEAYDAKKLGHKDDAAIVEIAVHSKFRHRGIAKVMLDDYRKWFNKSKYDRSIALIKEDNEGSKAMCKGFGFVFQYKEDEHEIWYYDKKAIREDVEKEETFQSVAESINRIVAKHKMAIRNINEESYIKSLQESGGSGIVGLNVNDMSVTHCNPGMFIIGYSERDPFNGNDDKAGMALSNDIYSKKILVRRNGKTVSEDAESFLENREICIYKFTGSIDNWNSVIKECLDGTESWDLMDEEYFYTKLTGKPMLMHDQIDYDKEMIPFNITRFEIESTFFTSSVEEAVKNYLGEESCWIHVMNEEETALEKRIQKEVNPLYRLYNDVNGIFIYNEATGQRTKSYPIDIMKGILNRKH